MKYEQQIAVSNVEELLQDYRNILSLGLCKSHEPFCRLDIDGALLWLPRVRESDCLIKTNQKHCDGPKGCWHNVISAQVTQRLIICNKQYQISRTPLHNYVAFPWTLPPFTYLKLKTKLKKWYCTSRGWHCRTRDVCEYFTSHAKKCFLELNTLILVICRLNWIVTVKTVDCIF